MSAAQRALAAFGPRIKRAVGPLSTTGQRILAAVGDAGKDRWRSVIIGEGGPPVELPPTCVSYVPSPSKTKLACFFEEDDAAAAGKKKLVVEIWYNNCLRHSCNVSSVHGSFVTNELLGGVVWSQAEDSLVYVADKLAPATPFVVEEDDLGEALVDVLEPSLVLLALGDEAQATVIRRGYSPALSPSNVLAYVRPTPNQLSKLGLVYCTTRPSEIRCFKLDKDLVPLGDAEQDRLMSVPMGEFGGAASRSPRWSPNGETLVFLTSHSALHNAPVQLCVVNKGSPVHVAVDVVADQASPDDFPSLYVDVLPLQPFLPAQNSLVVSSIWGATKRVLVVDIDTGRVTPANFSLGKAGEAESKRLRSDVDYDLLSCSNTKTLSASVLGVESNGQVLLHVSSLTWPGMVGWFSVNSPGTLELNRTVVNVSDTSIDVNFSVEVNVLASGCPSIVLAPKQSKPSGLVVMPHGGPHAANTTEFIPELAYFVRELNCAVLMVNYRGSVGQSLNRVRALPGNIGRVDVDDVRSAVQVVRARLGGVPVALCGGSHGGFLSAHLCAQFPEDQWSAVVLRNPVVNIALMVGTSDIPDWCWVEAVGEDAYKGQMGLASSDVLHKMFDRSPIAHVHGVVAPTLVHIGGSDRRVPPSQGHEWVRALRARGVEVACRRYAKDGHAIDRPQSSASQWQDTVEFLAAKGFRGAAAKEETLQRRTIFPT